MSKLSKVQKHVVCQMRDGSVIGELSGKVNGRYELFTRKPNWVPKTNHPLESPFEVKRINKNTVFALLAEGLIHKKEIAEAMWPFGRDVWYVFKPPMLSPRVESIICRQERSSAAAAGSGHPGGIDRANMGLI